ncbi:tetratricopeptide repeat protein [Phnomibacter ginsenosidimutans]|uniref:Tetratricopeptide repeat protein n=1 Tax=Phnomibacter ginsenosidimutans TaxID=2676868 RepID=A0A6I6G8L2_9BACT|nr:tetratricopeptide repeat protein [Phnomibacter ginsenosidimutans]
MSIKPIFSLIIFLLFCTSCKQTNEQLLDKALSSSKQKKYDKAIETYTKVINRNNKLQLAYYNRGFDYLATKQYDKALWDFNKVMALQSHGDFIITYNQNSPFADEEARAQIPYNDALYQRAQVKYFMDSLKSSFIDFQTLVDNNYEEKSNCLLWQGTIYVRSGKTEKACTYFDNAKQVALTDDDRNEATEMIKTYCGQTNNNR